MEAPKELKSISLNVETGELFINGDPVQDVSEFCLEFCDGRWELSLQQRNYYTTTGNPVQRSLEERLSEMERLISDMEVNIDVPMLQKNLNALGERQGYDF